MLTEKIAECCKKLKLSRNLVDMSDHFQAESNQEYLLQLLESEIQHRDSARKLKYLNKAGFYSFKSFESFNFEEVVLPGAITREQLKNCEFIDGKTNLILYGNVGTGKTHLSIAIGIEACNKGQNVKFFRTSALVNLLAEAKKKGTLSNFLKNIYKADLLIFDEWGYVPLERTGSQLLFEVISEYYEKGSIILNTNIEFSRWVNIFYDEQMTGAMIDRLLHHCHLLMFSGTSYRMRETSLTKTN